VCASLPPAAFEARRDAKHSIFRAPLVMVAPRGRASRTCGVILPDLPGAFKSSSAIAAVEMIARLDGPASVAGSA